LQLTGVPLKAISKSPPHTTPPKPRIITNFVSSTDAEKKLSATTADVLGRWRGLRVAGSGFRDGGCSAVACGRGHVGRAEFVRWVMLKDDEDDDAREIKMLVLGRSNGELEVGFGISKGWMSCTEEHSWCKSKGSERGKGGGEFGAAR
jgi:hypothetical protein